MKINEILTEKELKDCMTWGLVYSVDDIEISLARHYPEMEVKDYLLFRILMELQEIKQNGENYE